MWTSAVNKETLIFFFSPSLATFLLLSFFSSCRHQCQLQRTCRGTRWLVRLVLPAHPRRPLRSALKTSSRGQRCWQVCVIIGCKKTPDLHFLHTVFVLLSWLQFAFSIFDISSVVPAFSSKTVICFHEAEHRYDDRYLKGLVPHFGIRAFYISCQASDDTIDIFSVCMANMKLLPAAG